MKNQDSGVMKGSYCTFLFLLGSCIILASFSYAIEKYGGDDETRTRDLCRDRAAF